MKKRKKEYIDISLGELIPYENNPRENDVAVPDVEMSIEEIGYINPIIIDENNVIICGHTRRKALLEQAGGDESVIVDGVIKVYGLTEKEKNKYRVLDNKTGEEAFWNKRKLIEEIKELDFDGYNFSFDLEEEDFNLDFSGNDDEDGDTYADDNGDEDEEDGGNGGEGFGNEEIPELPKIPRVKLGDIWQL